MSDTTNMIREMARRLFSAMTPSELHPELEACAWPATAWQAVDDSGLLALLAGEELGFNEAFEVMHAAGRAALPLPLPEAMLANWLIARAGLDSPSGVLAAAPSDPGHMPSLVRTGARWRADGTLRRVPWGRFLQHVVFFGIAGGQVCVAVAPVEGGQWTHGTNMAGEPRDEICFRDHDVVATELHGAAGVSDLMAAAAATRAAQMAGAISLVLELTVQYAKDRQQFGRPIGNFQAVQHLLAVMAQESAAATMAAQQAFTAFDTGSDIQLCAAVAKVRTGDAAGIVARTAHEVLGAMGFALEHPLRHWTTRLWSWRAEYGHEALWARHIGAMFADDSQRDPWALLTAVDERMTGKVAA